MVDGFSAESGRGPTQKGCSMNINLRDSYLEAFRAANPGSKEPRLSYEHGWWVFRYDGDRIHQRKRAVDLELALNVLVRRARQECNRAPLARETPFS